jgi:hypothetical protein
MAKPQKDDQSKFNETLKRMLKTPPKPKKGKSSKAEALEKHDAEQKS